jgi:hypothetical protein
MKLKMLLLPLALSAFVVLVGCPEKSRFDPSNIPTAGDGVDNNGNFVNPDAEPLIYEPDPALTRPTKGEFFSHTQHGVDLPGCERGDKAECKEKELSFKGKKISCADCHNGECKPGPAGGKQVDINRPGHDSCAGARTGGCHPDFMTNQKICKSCHSGNPAPGRLALRPYGSAELVPIKDYGFDYDHTTHLGAKSVTKKRGKDANCATCHTEDKEGRNQGQAGHSQCGQCHCDSAAAIKMNDCVKCHEGTELSRSAHAYLDFRPHAQKFLHKDHRVNDKGATLDCRSCHVGVDKSNSLSEVAVPPMLGCLQGCHDGAHKDQTGKPIFDGWQQCSECHQAGKMPKSKAIKKKK